MRYQLQEKVAGMESFVGHLEEIFLTVEVTGDMWICVFRISEKGLFVLI